MHTKGVEREQSSISTQGGKQERVEKFSTNGNYKCSVHVVYDDVRRDNKWMGVESGMLGDIQGVLEWGEGQRITFLC